MMNEFEFNADNSQIGYRLQYLELLNWGTFHDKIWRIEPNGTNSLLTGSIGSGKSTLVDALTCLIVPHHKITFNKAANAESKERGLLSYIKGYYKFERDEIDIKGKAVSLRYNDDKDITFTVILANFSNVGYSSNVTLAQVLWIENEKPQKLLLISTRPLTVREYFTNFGNVKELRRNLKQHTFIEVFDDNFSRYSQQFRHLFGMNSDKAVELFYQTVSMKSVSSLTTFVREQMLERTDIKTQIDELKKRFDDLNKAHEAVQNARRQRDILLPLVELSENFQKFEQRIQEIDNIVQSIPSYFASRKIDLLDVEIRECERKLVQLNDQLKEIEGALKAKRKAETQVNQDIDDNGGKRLREIAGEIAVAEKSKTEKKERHSAYTELTSACGLPTANTEQTFYRNRKAAEQKIDDVKKNQDGKLEERAAKLADQRTLKEIIDNEEAELESLKTRVNQIPLEILMIRAELAGDLKINQEEIPFAGELLKVNDDEREWEGALERLLRGFGISMLVPEKYYRQVSQYINARRLIDNKKKGMRFEYYKVPDKLKLNPVHQEIDPDSVINKIDLKPDTPFQDWLQCELQKRFNLRCVSLEEFQRQNDVITREGQFKTGNYRHIKDDRRDLWDRKNFVLGWTNKSKIKAVEDHLIELRKKQKEADVELSGLKSEIDNNALLHSGLNQVLGYKNWSELNWQDEARRIADLEKEKTDLETSNDILKTLQDRLALIVAEIEKLEDNQKSKSREIGGIENGVRGHSEEIEKCRVIKNSLLQEEVPLYYPKIDELTTGARLTAKNADDIAEKLKQRFIGKHGEKDKLNEAIRKLVQDMSRVMKEYKDRYTAESNELTVEVESRGEYLAILDKIVNEGLPNHEARFKKMLNENTINDIVAFDSKLDNHFKSIKRKIEEINKHLKEIEFNRGTYIKLLDDRNSDREIIKFREELRECYSNILGSGDAYTEDRFNRVKLILDRFNSNDGKEIEWTNKVTDVRNWFIFNASERYSEGDAEKEFYAGTSGKSGGQKEKLAYTILASALAYQFGLSYGEPRSKSFRFVVIDEAFGRGDDESTQFGLGLFKKLNLQLLIVTPLQKIHIIENYINSVHYVSNVNGNNSELRNLTVEEYKEEKHLHRALAEKIEAERK